MSQPDQTTPELSAEELEAIERKYDEGSATRPVTERAASLLRVVALIFAAYHYITAGFGLPADHWHMGWHLAGLFILTYAFFPIFKTKGLFELRDSGFRIGNIPIYDLILMALGVLSALYVGLAWRGIPALGIEEQTFRMGNPNGYDILFGVIIILLVLDIARRTLGWVLPLIICVFMSYALLALIFPVFCSIPVLNLIPSSPPCTSHRRASLVSPCGSYLPLYFTSSYSVLSHSVPASVSCLLIMPLSSPGVIPAARPKSRWYPLLSSAQFLVLRSRTRFLPVR